MRLSHYRLIAIRLDWGLAPVCRARSRLPAGQLGRNIHNILAPSPSTSTASDKTCLYGAIRSNHLAAMAPPSGLQTSMTMATAATTAATATTARRGYRDEGLPPLARSATAPGPLRAVAAASQARLQAQVPPRPRPDPSHLAPEDAFLAASPPRRLNGFEANSKADGGLLSRHLRMRSKDPASRSHSRRRKRPWKKLLWVKQSCRSPKPSQHTSPKAWRQEASG